VEWFPHIEDNHEIIHQVPHQKHINHGNKV
jgi:hypothetical protein